jgi:hypothetical protein
VCVGGGGVSVRMDKCADVWVVGWLVGWVDEWVGEGVDEGEAKRKQSALGGKSSA